MKRKLLYIHGFGQADGYTRFELFDSEEELKDFILKTTSCPSFCLWINEEDIYATYDQLKTFKWGKDES